MSAAERPKLILVTGATDGIGRETALELARRGASVIVHGRDTLKLDETRKAVAKVSKSPVPEPLCFDFSSLENVRAMARELEQRGLELDVLVNNAGVYRHRREETPEGFELTFAVNHLAPFLLTHLLLEGHAGAQVERIVNVSSVAHASGKIDLEDPDGKRKTYDAYAAYAASKLANVLFTVELSRRLRSRGVDVNALHPGVVSTKLLKEGFGMGGPDSLAEGASTSVYLSLGREVRGVTGRYFVRSKETAYSPVARDPSVASRFYDISCRLTKAAAID